jgi:hypothetical protein
MWHQHRELFQLAYWSAWKFMCRAQSHAVLLTVTLRLRQLRKCYLLLNRLNSIIVNESHRSCHAKLLKDSHPHCMVVKNLRNTGTSINDLCTTRLVKVYVGYFAWLRSEWSGHLRSWELPQICPPLLEWKFWQLPSTFWASYHLPNFSAWLGVLSTFDFCQSHKEAKSRPDLSSLPMTCPSPPIDCGSFPVIDDTSLIPAPVGIMDDWRLIQCKFVWPDCHWIGLSRSPTETESSPGSRTGYIDTPRSAETGFKD